MKFLKNNMGFILIFLAILAFFAYNTIDLKDQEINPNPISTEDTNHRQIKVEVKGEVLQPGIYDCFDNDRVVDLINLAGGLTLDADTGNINQSERVYDEMVIIVPRISSGHIPPEDIYRYIYVEIKGQVNEPGVYKIKENAILDDLIFMSGGLTPLADTREVNLAEKLKHEKLYIIEKLVDQYIYVEVKGQVRNPGVYQMNQGDLLRDAIDEAGGLKEEAYTKELNLARLLVNNEFIYIYHLDDMLDEFAVEVKGQVKNPGVYYFKQETRVIDVIQSAGGFTDLSNYEKVNLSEIVEDEQVIIIPMLKEATLFAVDIKGQVKYPGVYYLKEGSRIIDVIGMAGGFRPDADSSLVNLSEYVYDEQVIEISEVDNDKEYFYVELRGQVILPGIYSFLPGERLISIINRAGGLTAKADIDNMNLTRQLEDQEVIVVPSIYEEKIYVQVSGEVFNPGSYLVPRGIDMIDLLEIAGGLTVYADYEYIDFYQVFYSNSSVYIPSIPSTEVITEEVTTQIPDLPNNPSGKVNINLATREELQTLTGIGVILAERIIDYRMQHGFFENIEGIMSVSGIGTSIYENIKDHITV